MRPSQRAVTPYPEQEGGRTAGWSGSAASQERAVDERDSGVLAHRQRMVYGLVAAAGVRGLTVAELRKITALHHGQASGALSNLHSSNRIHRLDEKRGRCHVYVTDEFLIGRHSQPHGRKRPEPNDRVKEAFIAGYRSGSDKTIASWEADIAYDLWERSTRG